MSGSWSDNPNEDMLVSKRKSFGIQGDSTEHLSKPHSGQFRPPMSNSQPYSLYTRQAGQSGSAAQNQLVNSKPPPTLVPATRNPIIVGKTTPPMHASTNGLHHNSSHATMRGSSYNNNTNNAFMPNNMVIIPSLKPTDARFGTLAMTSSFPSPAANEIDTYNNNNETGDNRHKRKSSQDTDNNNNRSNTKSYDNDNNQSSQNKHHRSSSSTSTPGGGNRSAHKDDNKRGPNNSTSKQSLELIPLTGTQQSDNNRNNSRANNNNMRQQSKDISSLQPPNTSSTTGNSKRGKNSSTNQQQHPPAPIPKSATAGTGKRGAGQGAKAINKVNEIIDISDDSDEENINDSIDKLPSSQQPSSKGTVQAYFTSSFSQHSVEFDTSMNNNSIPIRLPEVYFGNILYSNSSIHHCYNHMQLKNTTVDTTEVCIRVNMYKYIYTLVVNIHITLYTIFAYYTL